MALAPFALGARGGATPVIGTTLAAHYVAMDGTSMTGICGHPAPLGWAPAGGNLVTTDLSLVTCGACLAVLTRVNIGPANAA